MSPVITFSIGLLLLILFGWYFATDYGLRKRLLATTLMILLVAFSISTIYPPQKKIALGLDIKGGTSFLIRLVGGDKVVDSVMLEQAVEVIRKRVDYFGVGEPHHQPGRQRPHHGPDAGAEHGENRGSPRPALARREARVSSRLPGQRTEAPGHRCRARM